MPSHRHNCLNLCTTVPAYRRHATEEQAGHGVLVPLPVGEGWVDEGFAATRDVTSMTPPGVARRTAAQVEFNHIIKVSNKRL